MTRSIILFSLLLFAVTSLPAQSNDAAENIRMIEEKNFVFVARQMQPQRGASQQITSAYDLTVMPDTIVAFLPYFGRAFTAPVNPADGGIKFTSSSYGYEVRKRKKKGYEILVTPKDASGIVSLRLSLFDNGRGTLQVTQLNREPISFTGYIVAGIDRPKKAF